MAIKTVDLQIYIYEGTAGSYADTDLKYQIQKEILSGDTNVVFEIAELVRDYLDLTFNDDYLSRVLWVTTVATILDENDQVYTYGSPVSNTYIATNGYGYFEDEINPELQRHALFTPNTIYLPEGTAGKLPIFAEGVGKVTIDTVDTQITDNGNTNQKIQYVDIPSDSSIIQVYDTDDTTLLKTISVNNVCEPKYTPYKITFVNKYGAFQDLYFFKKTMESTNVSDETFKRNTITNTSSTYQTYEGQRQRYNVNSKTNLTMNTGFVKEDMNQTIEELFFSENVWIRYEGKTLPVIPASKSLQYKTSLNDKLINYTVDFEFAFDKINNVR